MMKNILKNFVVIVLAFVQVSCSNRISPVPTLQSTDTLLPKSTFTPAARPTLILGERQRVDAGGYSFQAPDGFNAEIHNASRVTIGNKGDTILISILVAPRRTEEQTVATVLDIFITDIGKEGKDLQVGQPYPVKVAGKDGVAADVSGTFWGTKSSGRVTIVGTGNSGFFVSFALASDGADGNGWETDGAQVFDAIMNSIQFFEPVAGATTGACTISNDATYGYTSENPIKVGGDDFDGPPRERAYLDNLTGPKGEKISYVRQGSNSFGDALLDIYRITGLGKDVILYIDEYSYTEPLAPLGFGCIAAFPLTKP